MSDNESTTNLVASTSQDSVKDLMKDEKFIKDMICKGATENEYQLFKYFCNTKGVHPLDKKILFVKRGNSVSYQASIDYLRQVAESSGAYDGQDEPIFETKASSPYPTVCKVSVYRRGIPRPFVGVAFWNEFYPGEGPAGFFWRKMPFHMLAKCAEALGLRKAFPGLLDKIYTPEEMGQSRTTAEIAKSNASSSDEKRDVGSVGVEYDGLCFDEPPKATEEPKQGNDKPVIPVIQAVVDAFEGEVLTGSAMVKIVGVFKKTTNNIARYRVETVSDTSGKQDYFTENEMRAKLAKILKEQGTPVTIEYMIKRENDFALRIIQSITTEAEQAKGVDDAAKQ